MPKRKIVPEGAQYGRLTVLRNLPTKSGQAYCLCRCTCGTEVEVRTTHLRRGAVKSCGCLYRDHAKTMNRKHGDYKTRLYSIWSAMNSRCYWSEHPSYKNYGGRGIKVAREWRRPHGYLMFKKWAMANGYADDLTIERVDVDKSYGPSNCTWVKHAEQARNLRKTIWVDTDAGRMCLSAAVRHYGNVVSTKGALARVQSGKWTPLAAASTPAMSHTKLQKGTTCQ